PVQRDAGRKGSSSCAEPLQRGPEHALEARSCSGSMSHARLMSCVRTISRRVERYGTWLHRQVPDAFVPFVLPRQVPVQDSTRWLSLVILPAVRRTLPCEVPPEGSDPVQKSSCAVTRRATGSAGRSG